MSQQLIKFQQFVRMLYTFVNFNKDRKLTMDYRQQRQNFQNMNSKRYQMPNGMVLVLQYFQVLERYDK